MSFCIQGLQLLKKPKNQISFHGHFKLCGHEAIFRDTFYGDSIAKLIWRLYGDLICYVLFKKAQDNLQANFTVKPP